MSQYDEKAFAGQKYYIASHLETVKLWLLH